MEQSKNQSKNNGTLGVLSFLGGLAAGAAAVFFSKKENRDKVKEATGDMVEKAKTVADDATKKVNQFQRDVRKESAAVKTKVGAKASEVKKVIGKTRS